MMFLISRRKRRIIQKLGDLQLALAKANDEEINIKNGQGLKCYHDLSNGIMDVVSAIDGERAIQIYAASVLPFYMGDLDIS